MEQKEEKSIIQQVQELLAKCFPAGEVQDADDILDELGFQTCCVCDEFGFGLQQCNACSEYICNDDIQSHIEDETGLSA